MDQCSANEIIPKCFKFLSLDENFRSFWIDRVLSNGLLNGINLMEMYILISFIFLLHLQLCYEKSFVWPSTLRLESLLTGIKEIFHSALVSDLKIHMSPSQNNVRSQTELFSCLFLPSSELPLFCLLDRKKRGRLAKVFDLPGAIVVLFWLMLDNCHQDLGVDWPKDDWQRTFVRKLYRGLHDCSLIHTTHSTCWWFFSIFFLNSFLWLAALLIWNGTKMALSHQLLKREAHVSLTCGKSRNPHSNKCWKGHLCMAGTSVLTCLVKDLLHLSDPHTVLYKETTKQGLRWISSLEGGSSSLLPLPFFLPLDMFHLVRPRDAHDVMWSDKHSFHDNIIWSQISTIIKSRSIRRKSVSIL